MTLPDNMVDDVEEPEDEIFFWEIEYCANVSAMKIGDEPSHTMSSINVKDIRIVSFAPVPEDDR